MISAMHAAPRHPPSASLLRASPVARSLGSLAVCVALAFGPAAHAEVPDELPALGDASSSLISPALEREIGQQFMKQVRSALPTVDDPILKYWVGNSLNDLAQYAQLNDTRLQLVLIDSQELNAFAAPGGVVGINMGLLLQAEDVHEYSSVVAHELAHLSQRHFARGIEEQRAQSVPTVASLLAAILVGAMGGADAGMAAISAAQAASQSSQLRYSRSREQEADRIGLSTMMRADLDPNGMARMFERMQRAYRYTRRPPEFLLTHPLSEARVADARQQAQAYNEPRHPDSPEYAMMRARALVRYADTPQAAVTRYEKAVRDNPDSPAARYGLALALSDAKRHEEALALGDQLFSTDPERILPLAAYADLLIKAGKYSQADRLLERGLALNPDNAPLSMLYAEALTRAQRYDAAVAVLSRQSIVNGNDIEVWYELAEVSGLAGDIIGVHRARAEFFALRGSYERAIQHLEYARRLVDQSNGPMLARLDQRLDDFRNALREARS
jgi:predicted Zn-dependent protease